MEKRVLSNWKTADNQFGLVSLASAHVRVIQRIADFQRYVAAEGTASLRANQLLWNGRSFLAPKYWLLHIYAKAKVGNANGKGLRKSKYMFLGIISEKNVS